MESFELNFENIQPLRLNSGPIVVVDDDPAELVIIKKSYEKSKRTNPLICLNSGTELHKLLEKVQKNETPMPALVLLDINMPNKNGFDILEEIRRRPEFVNVPIIIMITSSDLKKDKEQALKLKANGFLTKATHLHEYIKFFREI